MPADIPDIAPHFIDVTSVFNSGATVYQDKILLMLRVQNRAMTRYGNCRHHVKYWPGITPKPSRVFN